jgi:DNA-binding MarR family transcriptional regulator
MDAVSRESDGRLLAIAEREHLHPAALKALRLLSSRQEPVGVTGLAEGLGLSLPTASRAAHGLARRGLIDCHVASDDRRGRRLTLSAAGLALIAELSDARLAAFEQFAESLTPAQREALNAAISTLDVYAE